MGDNMRTTQGGFVQKATQLHEEAIVNWGLEERLYKAIEELSECLAALHAYKKKSSIENAMALLSELVDVDVVLPGVCMVLSRLNGLTKDDYDKMMNAKLMKFEAAVAKDRVQ